MQLDVGRKFRSSSFLLHTDQSVISCMLSNPPTKGQTNTNPRTLAQDLHLTKIPFLWPCSSKLKSALYLWEPWHPCNVFLCCTSDTCMVIMGYSPLFNQVAEKLLIQWLIQLGFSIRLMWLAIQGIVLQCTIIQYIYMYDGIAFGMGLFMPVICSRVCFKELEISPHHCSVH